MTDRDKSPLEEQGAPSTLQDKLQQQLYIVHPKRKYVLFIICILLIALIVWSFLGRIPTEISGRGVALSPKGVFDIEAKAAGVITEINVKKGDIIDPTTLLMTVYNPILKGIISNIRSTQFKVGQLGRELKILETSLQEKQELLKKGLIGKAIVSEARAAVIDKQISIQDAKSALLNYFSELERNSACGKEEIEGKEEQFFKEDSAELLKLESCLSQVRSPNSGRVLEILANIGESINVQKPLVWMEYLYSETEPLIFFSFVPIQKGTRISSGMKVEIEPVTVNPQEYGSMMGTVTEVSSYAVSEQELMNTLHNHQLVNYLIEGAPAALQLTVAPIVDEKTPSGYKWTSGDGPPFKIPTGTIGTIKVLVEEQPPISYLIPLWKLKPHG